MDNQKESDSKTNVQTDNSECIISKESEKILENVTGGGFVPKPIGIEISKSSEIDHREYPGRGL